jgi:DNA-binding response OmpR family regulator
VSASILIVEDDENLRLALQDNLEAEGYSVQTTADGRSARAALAAQSFDLVLLDIMLPDTDGYALCRELRERRLPTRVMMLTARTLEDDLVRGFDAGADDYLAKPYRLRELLARVAALVRRGGSSAPTLHRFAGFAVDVKARTLHDAENREIALTRTEFDLLACLLRNPDRAMTRLELIDAVWGGIAVDLRTVDNFVSSLKKKLGWCDTSPFRIETIRGVGYRMEIDAER